MFFEFWLCVKVAHHAAKIINYYYLKKKSIHESRVCRYVWTITKEKKLTERTEQCLIVNITTC